ncbi:MAG: GNAT family N-acetyltransferase, partial [Mesorhizobium sp.]
MAVGLNIDIVGDPTELTAFETRHVPGALKLSQEMGWPYRSEDWEFAARVGEGLVLERSGEVIGSARSAQGGGNGSRLFNALLEATEGRNVLLNSTEDGLTLYRRRGFTVWGTVLQHQGQLNVPVPAKACADIRPATVSDLPALRAFDERATGMPRGPMVAALADVGDVVVIDRRG